jgi:hypothetical protein
VETTKNLLLGTLETNKSRKVFMLFFRRRYSSHHLFTDIRHARPLCGVKHFFRDCEFSYCWQPACLLVGRQTTSQLYQWAFVAPSA